MADKDWRARVAQKQERDQAKIPKDWLLPESMLEQLQHPLEKHPNNIIAMDLPRLSGLLTPRELEITEAYDVVQLVKSLASGELSAVEVTIAFSKRAALAGQLTNCLTETCFPEAEKRARELDEMRSKGHLAGPLHGLPVSIKDSFKIKGLEATTGFVSFIDDVAEQNSALVDVLLDLGAVLYVKTNIPHTMMTADSHNHIFGRSLNPHNTALTAGGSSGGEGALMAFRGAPVGVGTDIAGSIRIPSLCDGVYGFKPTSSRVPYGGQSSHPGAAGRDFFLACAGPLCNDIQGLQTWMKAVIGARPAQYDTTTLDIPWREVSEMSNRKLRLGVLAEDRVYPLHPPVRRALSEAVRRLQSHGHELVELRAGECRVADAAEIGFAFFGVSGRDGGPLEDSGEDPVPSVVFGGQQARRIPKTMTGSFPEDVEGIPRLAALNAARRQLSEHWRKLWNTHQLDAVIGPPSQHTAVPHDTYGIPAYTIMLNTLDYPACVMPFGKSSRDLDPKAFSPSDQQLGASYDPVLMQEMPCSVQVFTSKMRDEECLAIAATIDKCLNVGV
jgi:amidase